MNLTPRLMNLVGFLVCSALMGFALFSQYVMGYEPCPLCVFQRLGMIAVGGVLLVAALHNPGVAGRRVYGVLAALAAAAGGSVSAWHLRLQNLPPSEVPDCGPGLDYMLDAFPLLEALKMVFSGSGECAEVVWRFLGLSMPAWVLIWFVILAVAALWNNFRRVAGPATR